MTKTIHFRPSSRKRPVTYAFECFWMSLVVGSLHLAKSHCLLTRCRDLLFWWSMSDPYWNHVFKYVIITNRFFQFILVFLGHEPSRSSTYLAYFFFILVHFLLTLYFWLYEFAFMLHVMVTLNDSMTRFLSGSNIVLV